MKLKPYYEMDYEDEEYYELNKPRITSVEDWKIILQSEMNRKNKFNFVQKVLVEMYDVPNKTIFCKEFENKMHVK